MKWRLKNLENINDSENWFSEKIKLISLQPNSSRKRGRGAKSKKPQVKKREVIINSSVQLLSHVQLFATPWTAARQASLSITISRSPPKPMSLLSVMPSKPSHPLSSPSPPAFNLSQHQGLFKWVSSPHQVAKVLESQLQHQYLQWTPRTELL